MEKIAATDKKFLVEFGETKKVFICLPSQLIDKVREAFKLGQPFQLQVYDEDYKVWADVTDIEKIPELPKLRVVVEAKSGNSAGGDTLNIGHDAKIEGVVVGKASGNAKIGGKGAQFVDTQNIDTNINEVKSTGTMNVGRNITSHQAKDMKVYNGPVTRYGKNAQFDGSRDTYFGKVDKSINKTTFGNNTHIGDTYDNKKVVKVHELSGENVHLGVGDINKNTYTDDHSVRKTLKAGAILAEKNAVVATGGSQAIGSKAQVGQMVGANANVGDATIQFRTAKSKRHLVDVDSFKQHAKRMRQEAKRIRQAAREQKRHKYSD